MSNNGKKVMGMGKRIVLVVSLLAVLCILSSCMMVSGSGLERTAPDSPLDPKDFMSDDDFIEHLTQVSKELLHDGLIIE